MTFLKRFWRPFKGIVVQRKLKIVTLYSLNQPAKCNFILSDVEPGFKPVMGISFLISLTDSIKTLFYFCLTKFSFHVILFYSRKSILVVKLLVLKSTTTEIFLSFLFL